MNHKIVQGFEKLSKNRLPKSQRKSDLGIPLPYTWLNPSTRPNTPTKHERRSRFKTTAIASFVASELPHRYLCQRDMSSGVRSDLPVSSRDKAMNS
jgi:hypothetical protein